MVNITNSDVPSFDKLMWPALVALKEIGGSATNEELLAKVIDVASISDDAASVLHSDGRQTKVAYNLAWARTYLKKAGALSNSTRGVWALTEKGERLAPEHVAAIPGHVRSLYGRTKGKSGAGRSHLAPDSEETAFSEDDEVFSDWKNDLLNTLRTMSPAAFERLAQRLLRESGFVRVEVTGRVGDGGIDGLGVLRLNFLSFHVLFQCKRYSGSVGARDIRDFRGAMIGRSDKGLFITTGSFTADAKKEATRDGAPPIELIDGDQLCDKLKDLGLGVRIELVERISVDSDFFVDF